MKIVHVVPRTTLSYGGPATLLRYLVPALVSEGADVRVFSAEEKGPGIPEPLRPYHSGFRTTLACQDYLVTPGMEAGLLSERPDLIHVHCVRNFQAEIAASVAAELGVPLVVQAHGTLLPLSLGDALVKLSYDCLIGAKVLRRASLAIAVSQEEVDHYRQWGIPRERISNVVQGVDIGFFRPDLPDNEFRMKFNLKDDTLVLCVGRLHKRKGFQHAIRAFGAVELQGVRLVIVGPDGGYLSQLRHLAERLGIGDRVCFTGPISIDLLAQAYNAADILVGPARFEIFGFTLLEAAACGTPAIATKWGAAREIVSHGRTGFLLDSWDDVDQLSELISWALSNSEETCRFGRLARDRICHGYSIERSVREFLEIYRGCLSKAS